MNGMSVFGWEQNTRDYKVRLHSLHTDNNMTASDQIRLKVNNGDIVWWILEEMDTNFGELLSQKPSLSVTSSAQRILGPGRPERRQWTKDLVSFLHSVPSVSTLGEWSSLSFPELNYNLSLSFPHIAKLLYRIADVHSALVESWFDVPQKLWGSCVDYVSLNS